MKRDESSDQRGRKRRSGRPSGTPLDEETIARAALDLIDESGWQACTMTALAARLGVRTPSLYHHVENQQSIIDLVRALVVREIDVTGLEELPWDSAMREFGIAYYRAFTNHPNTIQVLSTAPVRDRETLLLYEVFLEALGGSGWRDTQAFEALLGLEHLALGFAFEWNADELMLDPARCTDAGAPRLAGVIEERERESPGTSQTAFAEEAYLGLLRRYIEMFRTTEIQVPTTAASSTTGTAA